MVDRPLNLRRLLGVYWPRAPVSNAAQHQIRERLACSYYESPKESRWSYCSASSFVYIVRHMAVACVRHKTQLKDKPEHRSTKTNTLFPRRFKLLAARNGNRILLLSLSSLGTSLFHVLRCRLKHFFYFSSRLSARKLEKIVFLGTVLFFFFFS